MMLSVAILAGGLATRLWPVTKSRAKSLIEVNGEPFIAHQLRNLCRQGVENVVLCTGYLGEQINDFVGDGRNFALQVRYSDDGATRLGTGGAIRKALPLLGSSFFTLYGDSYLTCDFLGIQRAFEKSRKAALMTIFRNHGRYDRSNVEFRFGRITRYDKVNGTASMQYIDHGLGAFDSKFVQQYPLGEPLDLAQIYQDALAHGLLYGVEVNERFYEIGSFQGLKELSEHLSAQQGLPGRSSNFSWTFLQEVKSVTDELDVASIDAVVMMLAALRERRGRLFILGIGGSAANASHAVNDFRKIVGLEAYAPTDNVSELTARTNDEGWANVFQSWLAGSQLSRNDAVFILSVGGGDAERNISPNLVNAVDYANSIGATVLGIVGRDGGYTAKRAHACIVVPTVNSAHVTPHSESFQSVIWHLLVSHPDLKREKTKWESMK